MSRARDPDDADTTAVTITQEGEWYVARDEASGVASQGDTRATALANLAEALELHEEPLPDDAEATEPDAPWFSE